MRTRALGMIVLLLGCSNGAEPAADRSADIAGSAIDVDGKPLANATMVVDCQSGAFVANVPLNGEGRFSINLQPPAALLASSDGELDCQFGAPDSINGRLYASRRLFFTTIPHPVQLIDLKAR